ncbi:MAG: hypothetical protein ACXWV8_04180 [Chitinophagaceae bacterium]
MEVLEYIEITPVKKKWKKKAALTNTIPSPIAVKSINEVTNTGKANEPINDFTKWVMPSQPQAYIKCPRYDFF